MGSRDFELFQKKILRHCQPLEYVHHSWHGISHCPHEASHPSRAMFPQSDHMSRDCARCFKLELWTYHLCECLLQGTFILPSRPPEAKKGAFRRGSSHLTLPQHGTIHPHTLIILPLHPQTWRLQRHDPSWRISRSKSPPRSSREDGYSSAPFHLVRHPSLILFC